MFVLHSSNRTENLVAHLQQVIAIPPTSPFASELLLIQSQGMERWLSQQLATHFKVWGNFQFLFPNRFFSHMANLLDSSLNDERLSRECLHWEIDALLRQPSVTKLPQLQQYLNGEQAALKRFQLAGQLAQLFDQYQMLRPDMLEAWQQGESYLAHQEEHWQRHLWCSLMQKLQMPHRGALWLQCITLLNTSDPGAFQITLPERVMVFGVNTMPPLSLAFLQALSRHMDVHLYMLNPAQDYWLDLQSKRQRLTEPLSPEQLDGHPLLASLGQQGREFQQLLLEQENFEYSFESYEASEDQHGVISNLQQLQNDILSNSTNRQNLLYDDSISLHACHSRLREMQVLKNLLLDALQKDKHLQMRDIVVMAPDIQQYEPFIHSVFHDVQHAIADRSMRRENALLDLFIRFFQVSTGRFACRDVLDLLEQPEIYQSFDLSACDLPLLRHWLSELQIRWGKSAEHRIALELPGYSENSWQAALQRLLMGYAIADDSDFVADILPYADIEGGSAQALGGLCDFLQLLFQASTDMTRQYTLQEWASKLDQYSRILFAGSSQNTRHSQQLSELISDLQQRLAIIHELPVSADVLLAWLQSAVQESKTASGFLRGQITFCSMLPMRSIPFKVIALIGLREGEFPRVQTRTTFDLLAHNYRKGDRSRRLDDRYQFLELLLSARQKLIMTYIGFDEQNNEPKQPSVLINELRDSLKNQYDLLLPLQQHPMHGYSPRYFQPSSEFFNYHQADRQTAEALLAPKQVDTPWWQGELATEEPTVIDIADLLRFYRQPQRYFFRKHFALYGVQQESLIAEREPFEITGLDNYQINQQWIASALQGDSLSCEKLQAQGNWLMAAPGEVLYTGKRAEIGQFVSRINSKNLGARLPEMALEITVDNYRLSGVLDNIYEGGSLLYRYADLKGKDLLVACFHHLLSNRQQARDTYLISKDFDLCFKAEMASTGKLQTMLQMFLSGQKQPQLLFTEAALAYAQRALKIKTSTSKRQIKSPFQMAATLLEKQINSDHEWEITQLCGSGNNPEDLFMEEFRQFCEQFVAPLWEDLHILGK